MSNVKSTAITILGIMEFTVDDTIHTCIENTDRNYLFGETFVTYWTSSVNTSSVYPEVLEITKYR